MISEETLESWLTEFSVYVEPVKCMCIFDDTECDSEKTGCDNCEVLDGE